MAKFDSVGDVVDTRQEREVSVIKALLKANDFDGLFHDNDCGCKIDDLFSCGEITDDCDDCEPGIEIPCPGKKEKGGCQEYGDCEYHIAPKNKKNLELRVTPEKT